MARDDGEWGGDEREIDDLSSLSVSSRDRGLQITVVLPDHAEQALGENALAALETVGQTYLTSVLLEAQRLAAGNAQSPGLSISSNQIRQAEGIERRRLGDRKDAWQYLRDACLAGFGAGLSLMATSLEWALAVIVPSGVLFHFLDRRR